MSNLTNKMKKKGLGIILIIATGIGMLSCGQIKKIHKHMDLYNYSEALSILNRSWQKENTDKQEITLLMAECYYKQNNIQQAQEWYEKTLVYGNPEPVTLFHYAQILRSSGNYRKAKEYFLIYYERVPGDQRANILAGYCDSVLVWQDIPPVYEVKNVASLNSEQSEFGPVFYENRLCFTSDRIISKNSRDKYGWTGNSYLRLFYAEPIVADDFYNEFKEIRLAPDLFNQTYHDGPASFNHNYSDMYFNRTTLFNDQGKKDQNRIRTHLLKIYSTERNETKWRKPVPFFLNNDTCSVGHPSLSLDGNVLYFVSDMEGGYGGTDLYLCRRDDSGWSHPANLGSVINTFGNEMFPFVAENGDLYFASDGHPGFGGLDLFLTRQIANNTWLRPQNLNQPINTSFDDFSLCIAGNNKNGVFSSNRPGGLGDDDLYLFRKLVEVPPEPMLIENTYLTGFVKDKRTLNPIKEATVFLLDQGTNRVVILKTDANGLYKTQIDPGVSYTGKAMHPGYISDCYLLTPDTGSIIYERFAPRDLLLDRLQENRTFVLENIYYDLDNSYIRPDAEQALDKLVSIMKENPVSIELGSHCDSRASDSYNMILSQHRAESAIRYVVSKGVNPDRLTAKGYGETQLVNKCRNDVPCTEEEHQMNRRTEFKVISHYEDIKKEAFNPSHFLAGDSLDAGLLPDRFFDICR